MQFGNRLCGGAVCANRLVERGAPEWLRAGWTAGHRVGAAFATGLDFWKKAPLAHTQLAPAAPL